MGLFDFFRKIIKNKTDQPIPKPGNISQAEHPILLAMPVFINNRGYDFDKVIDHLKTFWKLSVTELSGDNATAVFDLDGQPVAIANMPVPVPEEELDAIIDYAYLWREARETLKHQTNHAIVSVLSSDRSETERHTLLSKMLCSILMTSPDCIAIYQGQETLLLQRDFYLACIEDLQNGRIPVPAWVYIGLRKTDEGINAYTYGMKSFGKPEFEIIGTPLDADSLYTLVLNIASYTIGKDVIFNNGDTFSLAENAKMEITESQGIYVDGTTLKLSID